MEFGALALDDEDTLNLFAGGLLRGEINGALILVLVFALAVRSLIFEVALGPNGKGLDRYRQNVGARGGGDLRGRG